jgi:hypothetical protein
MKKILLSIILLQLIPANSYPAAAEDKAYSIKGYVKDNIGDGISGVKLDLSGPVSAGAISGPGGYYELNGLTTGEYAVFPLKEGYSFLPEYRSYLPLKSDMVNQNFHGSHGVILFEIEKNEINRDWASVTWKTDISATSQVEYGPTPDYGQKSGVFKELLKEHYVKLYELTPDTTYHYRVVSSSIAGGRKYYSGDYTLLTTISRDTFLDRSKISASPNPCKRRTNFIYFLNRAVDEVYINIYSLSGVKVAELESNLLDKGWNKFFWDLKDSSGNRIPNGLYVYQIKVRKGKIEEKIKKMDLMVIHNTPGEPGQCDGKTP